MVGYIKMDVCRYGWMRRFKLLTRTLLCIQIPVSLPPPPPPTYDVARRPRSGLSTAFEAPFIVAPLYRGAWWERCSTCVRCEQGALSGFLRPTDVLVRRFVVLCSVVEFHCTGGMRTSPKNKSCEIYTLPGSGRSTGADSPGQVKRTQHPDNLRGSRFDIRVAYRIRLVRKSWHLTSDRLILGPKPDWYL